MIARSREENNARMYWRLVHLLHDDHLTIGELEDTLDELDVLAEYSDSVVLRRLCMSAIEQTRQRAAVGGAR